MNDKVLTRLQNWIAHAGMAKGARLPAERELCTILGVTRTELREALLVLEANGSLVRQVGRGTFLAKSPKSKKTDDLKYAIDALAETTGPMDAMNARLVLEPEMARLAATHASPAQLRELRQRSAAMRGAPSWAAYEVLDHEFHELIAAAAGNSLLQALHRIVNDVRFVVVWRREKSSQERPDAAFHSFAEHDQILDALERRQGQQAHAAMHAHLQSTLKIMSVSS